MKFVSIHKHELFWIAAVIQLICAKEALGRSRLSSGKNAERVLESDLCPTSFGNKKKFVLEPNNLFKELSYMVSSKKTYKGDPVIWMGSDGYHTDLNAVNLYTGKIIKTFIMGIPNNARGGDIESMALGPCKSSSSRMCIYVGNTGNNSAHACRDRSCTKGRDTLFIYKIEEPDLEDTPNGKTLPVATIAVDYHNEQFPTKRADAGKDSIFNGIK